MRCFDTTFRSMNPQVLSRSFRAKTTQSTTAITSIMIMLTQISFNNPSLRERIAESTINPSLRDSVNRKN
ncbi:hypothetical protein ACWIUD_11790 [Helicobacter sp. 23-1044]